MYTAPSINSRLTSLYAACVLLSLEPQDFVLSVGGEAHRHQALAIRPLLERGLQAESKVFSMQIYPTHPLFRRHRQSRLHDAVARCVHGSGGGHGEGVARPPEDRCCRSSLLCVMPAQ